MDNKLINRYGEDILSYRIRTARNKKRMQYEDFHKKLRKLSFELSGLYRQLRNLGWEDLKPPVQKGWKRSFVLREDVNSSKSADFYAEILTAINTVDYSWRKDFLIKKRLFGKKKYIVKEQSLKKPDEWEFKKTGLTQKQRELFYAEFILSGKNTEMIKRYVFSEPWRFVLKVQPNMIFKIRIRDPDIESRVQEINSYLDRNDYQKIIDRIRGRSGTYWKGMENDAYYGKSEKKKPVSLWLEEIKKEL